MAVRRSTGTGRHRQDNLAPASLITDATPTAPPDKAIAPESAVIIRFVFSEPLNQGQPRSKKVREAFVSVVVCPPVTCTP